MGESVFDHFPHGPAEWQEEYTARIVDEFAALKPYLPRKIDSLLDIGCGLGGIDVLIARKARTKTIHLVDGYIMNDANKNHGYHKKTKPWTDVDSAGKFVKDNYSLADVRLHYYDKKVKVVGVDLILSMWSWGFHYPVAEYMPVALANPKARIVLDIRKGVGGPNVLYDAGYKLVATIADERKRLRGVFAL
jgi:hypothetical protein